MSTDTAGSITVMIRSLRLGDEGQVATLWERYFDRLTRLAHPIVRFGPQAARQTEDDVVLSAINAFCDGIANGKFPYVDSREVLWGTLATITERKALERVRRWKREVSFEDLPTASLSGCGGSQLAVVEPTPEYQALVRLVLTELIEKIDNPLWRQAVLLLHDGHTVPEIARNVGRSREAVYVWFRAIREIWKEHLEDENILD